EAAGRGLERLVLRVAQLLARGHELSAVGFQPPGPFGTPATPLFLDIREPLVLVGAELLVHPVAALVLRRGVDRPGDVPGGAEDELHLAPERARAAIAAAPGHDVILPRR